MAIDLEVKHRLRELEARIKALEDRPIYTPVISKEILDELARLEAGWKEKAAQDELLRSIADRGTVELENAIAKTPDEAKANNVRIGDTYRAKKMCPKCGVKPAYFFHVRACKG